MIYNKTIWFPKMAYDIIDLTYELPLQSNNVVVIIHFNND